MLPQIFRHRPAMLAVVVGVLAAGMVASLALGARSLTPAEVWDALIAGHGTSPAATIVVPLRLPRTLLVLLVGAAICAAGALSQGFTRNPIADPGIIGVTAGAGCAVVTGVFLLGTTSPLSYVAFGFVGAATATGVVLGVSTLAGGSPLSLVLVGAGLSASLLAVSSAIVLSDDTSLDVWRFWNVGSLDGRDMSVVAAVSPFILGGLVLAAICGVLLNVLSLGDSVSQTLGIRLGRARFLGILAIAVLGGSATAACGPMSFLGLLAPHAARRIAGADYRWIIPFSALLGATLILICDVAGRLVGGSGELPTGIMLVLVGAPFLMLIVGRQQTPL